MTASFNWKAIRRDGPWGTVMATSTSPDCELVLKGPATPVTAAIFGPVTLYRISLRVTPNRLALTSLVIGMERDKAMPLAGATGEVGEDFPRHPPLAKIPKTKPMVDIRIPSSISKCNT